MLSEIMRSNEKNQQMDELVFDAVSEPHFQSDALDHKTKSNSLFNVPSLFVGFNPKNSESDSVRSPTSPLEFKLFSNLGNQFKSQRLSNDGHPKRWDYTKVGLRIIDCLENESKQSERVLLLSNSRNILFGPQMRIKCPKFCSHFDSTVAPKSLPKNVAIFPCTRGKPSNLQKGNSDVLFRIGEAPFEDESGESFCSVSLDSFLHLAKFANLKPEKQRGGEKLIKSVSGNSSQDNLSSISKSFSSGYGLIANVPPSEIELSEDYTCVTTHGSNPKVTHIFGDSIFERHSNEVTRFLQEETSLPEAAAVSEFIALYPASDFLKLCCSCKKKLDGEDIYMYRGESAFCSDSCRLQKILIDSEMEKDINDSSQNSHKLNIPGQSSKTTLYIDT